MASHSPKVVKLRDDDFYQYLGVATSTFQVVYEKIATQPKTIVHLNMREFKWICESQDDRLFGSLVTHNFKNQWRKVDWSTHLEDEASLTPKEGGLLEKQAIYGNFLWFTLGSLVYIDNPTIPLNST